MAGYLPYITNLYTNEQDFNNIKKVGSYSFGVNKEGYSNIPNVQSLEGVLVVIISVSNSNIYQIYLVYKTVLYTSVVATTVFGKGGEKCQPKLFI